MRQSFKAIPSVQDWFRGCLRKSDVVLQARVCYTLEVGRSKGPQNFNSRRNEGALHTLYLDDKKTLLDEK